MQKRWLYSFALCALSIAAIALTAQRRVSAAVLVFALILSLTSLMRADSLKAQGAMREARSLRILSIAFASLTAVFWLFLLLR